MYVKIHRLFTYLDEDAIFTRPTFQALIALFDNYNPAYGVNETRTSDELQEIDIFLDLIMDTEVMKETGALLQNKGEFLNFLVINI